MNPRFWSILLLINGGVLSRISAAEAVREGAPAFTITLRGTPEWNGMKEVRADLGRGVVISGRTVDLQGGRISGKVLKHPKNSQDENSVGVRIRIKGLTLKNGFVDDIPGGLIVFAPDVTLQNLTFTRAGEDFVSNEKDRSPGFRVLGCRFFNNKHGDKSIQANDGRGLIVAGNLLSGGTTAIRIQKKNARKQGGTAVVEANRFDRVNTAVNAAGRVTVFFRNNVFDGVSTELKTEGPDVRTVRR